MNKEKNDDRREAPQRTEQNERNTAATTPGQAEGDEREVQEALRNEQSKDE